MVRPDIERMAAGAGTKAQCLVEAPGSYLILSILAGIYLGFAITLIVSIGAPFAAALRRPPDLPGSAARSV
jgi:formate/nitrite transporter FocA (FNT family)